MAKAVRRLTWALRATRSDGATVGYGAVTLEKVLVVMVQIQASDPDADIALYPPMPQKAEDVRTYR